MDLLIMFQTIINAFFEKIVIMNYYIVNRNLLPPLILFVIDQSGSMGQTISVQTELNITKGVQTSSQQNKLIKISK